MRIELRRESPLRIGRYQFVEWFRRLHQLAVSAAIWVGGALMLAGSIYGMVFDLVGAEALATLWPFYLGGIVAVALGWLSGDLRSW